MLPAVGLMRVDTLHLVLVPDTFCMFFIDIFVFAAWEITQTQVPPCFHSGSLLLHEITHDPTSILMFLWGIRDKSVTHCVFHLGVTKSII
jgi:hypothetical protein